MKVTTTETMRYGKVEFQLSWTEEFPPCPPEFEKMFSDLKAKAFESEKTGTVAPALKKGYAAMLEIKPAALKTEMVDDPVELEKVFNASFKGSKFTATGFKLWTAQSEGQVSASKVLAWLQGFEQTMTIAEIIEEMDAADLKAAVNAS